MEKSFTQTLATGLGRLGLHLPSGALEQLTAWADELLKWNRKLNLTAITGEDEVAEKHLLDSLAVLPEVTGARHLLDLGAGAGLPGLPLAVALPELRATLVDTVEKKVGFLKSAAVKSGVSGRVRAVHARAAGAPEAERLPRADLVISRAFMDVGPFLQLARHYVEPGGRVVTMLGQAPDEATLRELASAAGLELASRRVFALPFSKDPRGVAVFVAPRST